MKVSSSAEAVQEPADIRGNDSQFQRDRTEEERASSDGIVYAMEADRKEIDRQLTAIYAKQVPHLANFAKFL